MDTFVYYPPRDFGPLMKGLVIGGVGIFHVFLDRYAERLPHRHRLQLLVFAIRLGLQASRVSTEEHEEAS